VQVRGGIWSTSTSTSPCTRKEAKEFRSNAKKGLRDGMRVVGDGDIDNDE
jgi:hypothetical protein